MESSHFQQKEVMWGTLTVGDVIWVKQGRTLYKSGGDTLSRFGYVSLASFDTVVDKASSQHAVLHPVQKKQPRGENEEKPYGKVISGENVLKKKEKSVSYQPCSYLRSYPSFSFQIRLVRINRQIYHGLSVYFHKCSLDNSWNVLFGGGSEC